MCGIAGIIFKEISQVVDAHMIADMCRSIHHRGPDEWGYWVEGHVGIGMQRLQIIDLAGGSQPIHNEENSAWIVFNGEIYNYRELRLTLEKKGHRFYTSSDTETILHAYEEYGEDCVDHLRGMFAFAVYDKEKNRLFIARDRLGIKPIHYLYDGSKLIFGSEIKSLLVCNDVPRMVHSPSIINYFAYGYVPDPDTMFDGIKKLPPGHTLSFQAGKIRIRQYWDVRFDNSGPIQSEDAYIEKILFLLNEAVKIRLMSEVPLGAFLSGGIDSSLVVALMAQHTGAPVKTFSIGFENHTYDELKFARIVAEKFGTEHHEEIIRPDAAAVILDLVRQFDEPFADSSAIPTYYVSRMTRKWVTVALSGDGGDELFGGYERYLNSRAVRLAERVPIALRRLILLNLASLLPEWFPGINTMRHLAGDADERYIRSVSKGISTIHTSIFSQELFEKIGSTDPSPAMLQYLVQVAGQNMLTRRQYLDLKTYLPGDILTKVDRTSMLVSLEARVPFLDHKLVEFAATIPPQMVQRNGETKYLLKKAAERYLPHQVIYRPKQGFAIPIKHWIKHEWRDLSNELVIGHRAISRSNFQYGFLKRIMAEHNSDRRDHSYLIWTLMVLELWFREFIDRA